MRQEIRRAFFLRTLGEWADQNGFELEMLSRGWVVQVHSPEITFPVISYDIGLNSSSVHRIVNDKVATFEVLNAHGIPALEHRIIVHPDKGGGTENQTVLSQVEDMFNEFGRNAVLKPTDQSHGLDVIHVQSLKELESSFAYFLSQYSRFSISPFIEIEREDRFYFLDDELLLSYGKRTHQDDFRGNLAAGAEVILHQGDETEARTIAANARKILSLRYGCVDVVTLSDGRKMVMEANSGVTIDSIARWSEETGTDLPIRDVYFKGLDALLRTLRAQTLG